MRKILFITGIRSDFYIQLPILIKAKQDKKIKSVLVVTGAHLKKKFGGTLNDIKRCNIKIDYELKNLEYKEDKSIERLVAFNNQISKLTKIIEKEKPDIIVSPFDREEALSTAIVGAYMNIPVAHLGAGDETKFNIDGVVRHAVSKLANILFCSNIQSQKKLLKIGENKKRIFNYGSTSLDRYALVKNIKQEILEKKFKINFKEGLIISLFHPVSGYIKESVKDFRNLLFALDRFDVPTIFICPNSDPGNARLRKVLKNYRFKYNKRVKIFKNIEEVYFVNLLKKSNLIVGNSSMGVYDSAFLKIPAINIGRRQKGRVNNKNVHFVKGNKKLILKKLKEYFKF